MCGLYLNINIELPDIFLTEIGACITMLDGYGSQSVIL